MSTPPWQKGSVGKVTLKRADICVLVRADPSLANMPFVKAMGAKADAVLKAGIARRYPDRAVLFQTGDSGNSLFFVLNGEVRLSGRKGADLVELDTAARGVVFGESEILTGEPLRTSSAVSQGDVDAAEFPRDALLENGVLMRELADFLRPIQQDRLKKLSEMTDFMSRW